MYNFKWHVIKLEYKAVWTVCSVTKHPGGESLIQNNSVKYATHAESDLKLQEHEGLMDNLPFKTPAFNYTMWEYQSKWQWSCRGHEGTCNTHSRNKCRGRGNATLAPCQRDVMKPEQLQNFTWAIGMHSISAKNKTGRQRDFYKHI